MKTKKAIRPSFSMAEKEENRTELHLRAPQSWAELSARQLKYVSWLLTRCTLTPAELQAYAFVRFTGLRIESRQGGQWICSYRQQLFTLSPEQALAFSRKMDFLTSGIGEIVPLPRMAGKTHVDPRLCGTPFKQYLACENYYQAYLFTKNADWLGRLAACFYSGGRKFNDAETQTSARRFNKQPPHLLYTAFLWYYGLKTVLQTHFPYFFQKTETILEDEEPQALDMRGQIHQMLRALTGGDVAKTEAVYNAETWTALAELNAKAMENKELENRIQQYKK